MSNIIEYSSHEYVQKIGLASIIDKIEQISFQRDIDTSRVEEIKIYLESHKQKTPGNEPIYRLLGLITIGHINNKYYCLDGQHRLSAYKDLLKHDSNIELLFHFVRMTTFEEVRDYFKTINKTVLIPDYIMYEENTDIRDAIKNAINVIVSQNRAHFVKRSDCRRKVRRPNMRPNELEDHIFHSSIDKTNSVNMIKYINRINTKLSNLDNKKFYDLLYNLHEVKPSDKFDKIIDLINKAKEKSPEKPFLLGMFPDYTWLNLEFEDNLSEILRST